MSQKQSNWVQMDNTWKTSRELEIQFQKQKKLEYEPKAEKNNINVRQNLRKGSNIRKQVDMVLIDNQMALAMASSVCGRNVAEKKEQRVVKERECKGWNGRKARHCRFFNNYTSSFSHMSSYPWRILSWA